MTTAHKPYLSGEVPEVGDVVRCERAAGSCLKLGAQRVVTKLSWWNEDIFLDDQGPSWNVSRFTLIKRKDVTVEATPGSKFWMVLGLGSPTYRHASKKSAATEAERLARLSPGEEFTVLEAVATVKKTDLAWTAFDPNQMAEDDVPF